MFTKTPPSGLEFASIPPDEMGFAMALFVNASNGRLSRSGTGAPRTRANHTCERLFIRLMCSDDLASATPKPAVIKDDLNLYTVFRSLWERYEGDVRQASVCARVLAFHFLMERTAGSAVEVWLKPCPNGPEAVVLYPAVVEALAGIYLAKDGLLTEDRFLNEIESYGEKRAHRQLQDGKPPTQYGPSRVVSLPVQSFPFGLDGSRLLAERLLAHEAISIGDGSCAASRVCQKLQRPFASLAGPRGFLTLAARARTLAERDGTIVSMIVEPDGSFQGLDCDETETAAVFIGHLISLPDRLIGSSLTRRLLQDTWPDLLAE